MQKLIKINTDHYIIVDDSEIKEGDYYLRYNQSIMKCTSIKLQFNEALNKEETIICSDECGDPYERSKHFLKKITHSTQPLELLTLSKNGLSGIGFSKVKPLNIFNVKELIGEVNVEKKAELYVWGGVYLTKQEKQQTEIAYMIGYNQALEDNKEKKYTEKDINKIRQILVEGAITNMSCSSAVVELDKYIQSLQPKTEWEVEIVDGKLKLK